MPERLDLTTPVPGFVIERLVLHWTDPYIEVAFKAVGLALTRGSFSHIWAGDQAAQMMRMLNTANFSTKSLTRRLFEQLVADGVLAGTVSGLPD